MDVPYDLALCALKLSLSLRIAEFPRTLGTFDRRLLRTQANSAQITPGWSIVTVLASMLQIAPFTCAAGAFTNDDPSKEEAKGTMFV